MERIERFCRFCAQAGQPDLGGTDRLLLQNGLLRCNRSLRRAAHNRIAD
jgi:hypothetical protein